VLPQAPTRTNRESTKVLLALGSLNILSLTARYVLPSVQLHIKSQFVLSNAAVGFLSSAFFFVFMAGSAVAGWLGTGRRHHRLMITIAVLTWSLFTLLSGVARSYAALLVTHSLFAIGEAFFAVIAPTVLANWDPEDRRNTAFTFYFLTIPIGTAAAFGLGSLSQHQSWRTPFYIVGIASLVSIAFAYRMLRQPSEDVVEDEHPADGDESAWSLATNARYIALATHSTCLMFASVGISVWLPTFLVRYTGVPLALVNSRLGLFTIIGGACGVSLGGFSAHQWAKRDSAAFYFISALSVVGAWTAGTIVVFAPSRATYYAVGATQFFFFMNYAPATAAVLSVVPERVRAASVAVSLVAAHALGDGLSPTFVGWIADRFGLRLGMELALLPLLIGAIALLLGARVAREIAAKPSKALWPKVQS
jgi:MFS family permease